MTAPARRRSSTRRRPPHAARWALGWAFVAAVGLAGPAATQEAPPAAEPEPATAATPAELQPVPEAQGAPNPPEAPGEQDGGEGPAEPPPPASLSAPPPGAVRVLRTGGLRMETAALLLSGQQGGPLAMAMYATPLAAGGQRVPVLVVIEVDGSELLAEQEATSPLYLEVCVYALDAKGGVQGSLLQTVGLDLRQLGGLLPGGGVKLLAHLALPPGELSLRALVRNVGTDNLGLRMLPLTVQAADEGDPVLLSVLLPDDPASWLTVPLGVQAPAPWGGEGAPAAWPIVNLGQPVELRLLTAGDVNAERLRVELRDATTHEKVAELPAAVVARQPATLSGMELLTLTAELPELDTGELELRVAGGGAREPSPALYTVITNELAGRSWAVLMGAPPPPPVDPVEQAEEERRRRRESPRKVLDSYRAALTRLAQGEAEAARREVAALEERLLSPAGGYTSEELRELELEELELLAAGFPDALAPVLALYQTLYREHRERRASLPATHAREMFFALAERYGGKGASEAARRTAAAALLTLAGELPPSGARVVLSRSLRLAQTIDPTNHLAALSLAIDAERNAEYDAAVTLLRRLVGAGGGEEARVRLAINRARLNETRAAAELLAAVVANPEAHASPPPWWLAVAYQELGRLRRAGRDLAAAEQTLREGLERFPGDEKLTLLLALVLEERGKRAAAHEVLAGFSPQQTDRGWDTARRRYNLLPGAALRGHATALRDADAAARPQLLEALQAERESR